MSGLPKDIDQRMRRSLRALGDGGGVSDAVLVAFARDGTYKVGGTNDRQNLARLLRQVADHIDRNRGGAPS